jgi:uncharacterized membrane protein YgcG
MDADNADSFYDRLLASIGPVTGRSRQRPPDPPKDRSPPPSPRPKGRVVASPTPPLPPTEPILQTNILTESPTEISPIEKPARKESREDVALVSPPDTIASAPTHAREKPRLSIQVSPVSKTSATLEAELRAKLLASTKKRKASVPPRPAPPLPAKRPPRGSPVFTAVPLSNTPSAEELARKQSFSQSPVSKSFPAEPISPLSQPHGKLALPPKPPQREGFRLRVKLPFPYSTSSFVTVETEKLALTTPISAILDLFNRRSPQDHLYFASISPQPVADCPDDTPDATSEDGVGLGLGIAADNGQRFYRDPPRNLGTGGWRDAAPSRGGPNWDPNVGNLRSTLEDVATVHGAGVVDCEIRSDPRPRSAGTAGTEKNGYFEEEEEGWEGEGEEWVSPAMEQGHWECHDPSYLQQQWSLQWPGAFPNPIMSMTWMDPAYQQPLADPEPEPAQRWIPGHQDYDNAGWKFGFPKKDEDARPVPSRPPPPPPTQVDILKMHGSRKESLVETSPSVPTTTPSAAPASTIPQDSPAAPVPSAPQGPRARNPLHEGKKQKNKKGGPVRNGTVKKKKGKDSGHRGGRGRSSGGGGGGGGGGC